MRVVAIGLDAMERDARRAAHGRTGRCRTSPPCATGRVRCHLRNTVAYRSELPYTQFLTGKDGAANRYWRRCRSTRATYDVATVGALDARPFYALGPGHEGHPVRRAPQRPGRRRRRHPDHRLGVPLAAVPASGPPGRHAPRDRRPLRAAPGVGQRLRAGLVRTRLPRGADRRAAASAPHRRVDVLALAAAPASRTGTCSSPSCPSRTPPGTTCGTASTRTTRSTTRRRAELARQRLVDTYQAVDAAVGRLVDSLPGRRRVVVFALHGMQPNENDLPSLVLLPELLHRLWTRPSAAARRRPGRRGRPAATSRSCPPRHRRWIADMQAAFAGRFRDDPTHWLRTLTPGAAARPRPAGDRPVRPAAGRRARLAGPAGDRPADRGDPAVARAPRAGRCRPGTAVTGRRCRRSCCRRSPTATCASTSAGASATASCRVDDYRAVGEQVIDIVRALPRPAHRRAGARGRAVDARRRPVRSGRARRRPRAVLAATRSTPSSIPTSASSGRSRSCAPASTAPTASPSSPPPASQPADLGERSALDVTPTILDLLGHEPPADMAGTSLVDGTEPCVPERTPRIGGADDVPAPRRRPPLELAR